MKKLLLLFLLFSLVTAEAQRLETESGPESVIPDPAMEPRAILANDEEISLIIRVDKKNHAKLGIAFLNDLKEEISSYTHEFTTARDDKIFYEDAAVLDNQFWIFLSHYHAKEHKKDLYAFPVNEKSIHTDEQRTLMSMQAYNPVNCGSYHIRFSPDKNHFVVTQEFPSDKTKNESISVAGFDESLQKRWTKDHTFDIPSQARPVNVPYINNNGDVFIVKKDRDKNQYRFSIYMISHQGSSFARQPANVNGANISDIKAGLNAQGQLIVTGFYSTQNFQDYEGMFYFRYDAGGAIAAKHTEPLNSELISQVSGKKKSPVTGFSLQHIVPLSTGDIHLLAEKTLHITEKPGMEHFVYDDIFILSLDPNGYVKGWKLVKKKQESFNDHAQWSSYNYWVYNDTLNIIFNKVIKDDQLASTGKKNKSDEFGDATFAGTSWYWLAPSGNEGIARLTGLHEGNSVQMAVDPDLLFQTIQEEVLLITEDYFAKKYRLIGLKPDKKVNE